jgi:hypothetical protein
LCRMSGFVLLLVGAACAWAAEPIAGTWQLKTQKVNERPTTSPPLTLRIAQSGEALKFEYSSDASLRFDAKLDGSPAEVIGGDGKKIGVARVKHGGPEQYLVTLEGPNRPTMNGKLTVSSGGKTLTSESDVVGRDGQKVHTVQVFARQ